MTDNLQLAETFFFPLPLFCLSLKTISKPANTLTHTHTHTQTDAHAYAQTPIRSHRQTNTHACTYTYTCTYTKAHAERNDRSTFKSLKETSWAFKRHEVDNDHIV